MEVKLNLNYNQLLKLICQLPERDKEKLTKTLQTELSIKKPTTKKIIQDLILNAPTWTEEELQDYQSARSHINKSRII